MWDRSARAKVHLAGPHTYSAFWTIRPFGPFGLLGIRPFEHSAFWVFGLLGIRPFGSFGLFYHSAFWSFGLLAFGLLEIRPFDFRPFGVLPVCSEYYSYYGLRRGLKLSQIMRLISTHILICRYVRCDRRLWQSL